MTTDKPIWFIAEHLCEIPHISLLTPAMKKRLTRVDRRTDTGRNGRPQKEIESAAVAGVVDPGVSGFAKISDSLQFGLCWLDAPLKR